MAYKYEKGTGDIIISGWEKGIAPSPHNGLGDLKCLNISTMPNEVSVNYSRIQQTNIPIVAGMFTASSSNVVTYTGITPLIPGTWVTIAASPSSTITNLDTSHGFASGASYYVRTVSSGNVTLSTSFGGSAINNFGVTGTATFSTINIGKPIAFSYTSSSNFPNFQYFVLDANGVVWENISGSAIWSALQPVGVGGATGIFCFDNYVFVAADKLYYKGIGSNTLLGTAWGTFKTINSGFPHPSALTPSDLLILGDGSQLDTLMTNPGFSFDPTNAATYTWTPAAVLLPSTDIANTIALIGNGSAATGGTGGATNVLVGGQQNVIYPWAPGTAFFQPVIFVSENYIQQMITVNNLVYIFAGSKGNVYITNGSSLTSVISVPDYVANSTGTNQDPYFIWGGAMYLRGRIWFSLQAPNCGGVWSFIPTINFYPQQDVGMSLRLEHQNSYGTYNGLATILFAPQRTTDQQAEGVQYWAGWDSGSSTYGIDFSGTTPYTNGAAIIETDLIPYGELLGEQKGTPENIEFKLSAPLVAGESIVINYRPNLTSAWASAGTIQYEGASDVGDLIGYISPHNVQNVFWLQFQVILISTASSPSFNRFVELRIRNR